MGAEQFALDTNEITDVQQLLEQLVVAGLVFTRAEFVPVQIQLHIGCRIAKHSERSLPHDASAHQPTGQTHNCGIFRQLTISSNLSGRMAYREALRRIGFDIQFPHAAQGFAPEVLLFTEHKRLYKADRKDISPKGLRLSSDD